MLDILRNRAYRHLFLAQIVAVLGNGLATVALGLLAYELAGDRAALVLSTILTLKMVAYVTVAPIAGALAARLPRKRFLVVLDVLRAAAALALPFVTELWQVYLLILILQTASAAFTPTLQATIPDVLTDEPRYTKALSLTRLAFDLESFLSPVLAAMLLAVLSFDALFVGTHLGFLASAALILAVALPSPKPRDRGSFAEDTTRGLQIYLGTPRLRGLFALSFSVAAAGAMVIVNTVVLVRTSLGMGESAVAWALGVFGLGSMLTALILPRLLETVPDRQVMSIGAALMGGALGVLGVWTLLFGLSPVALGIAWFAAGLGNSAILTPSGRLLRRSSRAEDRPAVFAAQFALSHACWLICYPLAGLLMTWGGAVPALLTLSGLAFGGLAAARQAWPADDPEELDHEHPELPPNHPHLKGHKHHRHAFTIDELHRTWPVAATPERRSH